MTCAIQHAPRCDSACKSAIVECGRMCERALGHAQADLDNGLSQHAEEWLERAEWWSDEAFRQVAP